MEKKLAPNQKAKEMKSAVARYNRSCGPRVCGALKRVDEVKRQKENNHEVERDVATPHHHEGKVSESRQEKVNARKEEKDPARGGPNDQKWPPRAPGVVLHCYPPRGF